jgi:thioredoxin reductase (NADPH)
MLTIDEIQSVPMFSSLPRASLEHLVRNAADIQLEAGEVVVAEGGERALYAVLSGRIEVYKTFDGVERHLGWREPGAIFGEVPLALGSPFPGAYRAVEPSRVMRAEARDYFTLAAACPDLATAVGALARERMGGLQSIAAEAPKPRVVMVGERWDGACGTLRRFLDRNHISFEWLAPDDPQLAAAWPGPLPAAEQLPALLLADGRTAKRPTDRELAGLLGLQTTPGPGEYDVVVIGGGPAGLAAAVYGASEGLRTIVVEREAPGGQAGTSSRIENYLGFPNGVSGDELASRALQQANRLGAEILVTRTVCGIDPVTREVALDGGEVIATKSVILATGVVWRRLAIEGAERLIGKGLFYGAARSEAAATHGLDLHLIGAGNSAGQAALNFANHARSVTLVVRGDSLGRSMSQYLIDQLRKKANIRYRLGAQVTGVHGETHLSEIDILDVGSGSTERCECQGLFVFIGADADTAWLPEAIALDAKGYVLTGEDVVKAARWSQSRDPYLLETSIPGVFASGDVRLSPVKRVAAAVGEGSMAIAFVHQYLQHAEPGAAAQPRKMTAAAAPASS